MAEDERDPREELAEERTDFAEDRTVMAMERTFAGWLRTAFAAIGIGLAFHALFGKLDPPWLARAIASGFIVLGAVLAISAERRACATFARLSTHRVDRPATPNLKWMSWSVAVGAALLLPALWWSSF